MKSYPWYCVKKRALLAIAGTVWLLAGFNVARLGVLDYNKLPGITPIQVLLSLLVFAAFGAMFYKMTCKHTLRIAGYPEKKRPIWDFFDLKSYCIMAFMMIGGILLRSSGLAPAVFIAVFYTGLGCALALAGFVFLKNFITL